MSLVRNRHRASQKKPGGIRALHRSRPELSSQHGLHQAAARPYRLVGRVEHGLHASQRRPRRVAGGALHRNRLRVTSSELPPPPGEPAEARKRQIQSPCSRPRGRQPQQRLFLSTAAWLMRCWPAYGTGQTWLLILPPKSQSVCRWRCQASISPRRHRRQVDGCGGAF